MTTRIKPGLPRTLRDLHEAVGKASRTVFDLHIGSTPEQFDKAADELYAAFAIAREFARPENRTGCPEHPQGAKDPADDGCLICNTRKRRATPTTPPVIALPGHARPQKWSTPRALERAKATDDERLPGDAPACTSCGSLLDADGACFNCARAS